jgi:hypothetical protein
MTTVIQILNHNRDQFSDSFVDWFPDNIHVWDAFVDEAFAIIDVGFKHYSARTIVHVLRHHSAIKENGSGWKINDHHSPYLARLFALIFPQHANLFEYRTTKSVDNKTESIDFEGYEYD